MARARTTTRKVPLHSKLEKKNPRPPTDTVPDSAATSGAVQIATHSFNQRYLFAFAPQAEVVHHLRTETLKEDRHRTHEVMSAWRTLQPTVAELIEREAGLPDTVRMTAIPEHLRVQVASIESDPLFQKTFKLLPITFELVEVDKLIAPQRTVNLDYVERLRASYPASPTMNDLIGICVSPKRKMDPIQHLELGPNTHVFSSPNSDIRLLGSFVKELVQDDLRYAEGGGLPAAAIITFVGYGGSPVNVLKFGDRIVLNNGFHRVFSLRSLGVEQIPVVVQHVQNFQLEFPPAVAGLPREYLLGAPRPVLIKDFFEPDFAITIRVQERLRVITVAVSHNQHDVPS